MKVHSENTIAPDKPSFLRRFVEGRLIGNFDSEDFTSAWHKKFSHAPTWCDADMSLQQINRGRARGNRIALYSRAFFQYWLFHIGCFVQKWAWPTVLLSIVLYAVCCAGLKDVVIETDIVKLWVSQGGRLNEELNFLANVQANANRIKRAAAVNATVNKPVERRGPELPKENGLGGGFQVVIQTPSYQGENVLTKEGLQRHTKLMQEIAEYKIDMWGESWTLADICFKPPGPSFNNGPLAALMSKLLDKIIPCIWITPIDCYWDGAKPLGPNPPINLGPEVASFVSSLPTGNVTWKNLNPTEVIKEVGALFDLGPIGNFFERAGIDGAYLDRPCIDPLDEECPKSSPNHFNRCAALKKFQAWNSAKDKSEQVTLERKEIKKEEKTDVAESILNDLFGKKRRKRQAEGAEEEVTTTTAASKKTSTKDEDYYDYEEDADYVSAIANSTQKKKEPVDTSCEEYGASLLTWMRANTDRLGEFLTAEEMPKYPNYGDVMSGGCKGFGKKIMEWPEDLIIGGIKRENGKLKSAEALQSVFLVSSPYDVFLRVKEDKSDSHPKLNKAHWSPYMAEQVIVAWQRNFTKKLYAHEENHKSENHRVFHPLASTSIADMLEEFSQFNYTIIILGYVLMVIYAAFTQARIEGRWLAIQSNVLIAVVGVIMVTFASICGLGLSTMMGINFNAATTQVVPFLSLGLGIDDMFLLLHNYDEIINICRKDEIGILLKETGMSVMVTSINNILAFVSGIVLPIPALRSFCSQTAILLAFNLVFLMFIFPAIIGLDLRRQRAGKRDLLICSRGKNIAPVESVPSNVSNMSSRAELAGYQSAPEFQRHEPWYTVGGFLNGFYIPLLKMPLVKAGVLLVTLFGVVAGLYGMYSSTLGLELADVLPEHTPPAAFLRAREKYFSFYPMFAVLRGETIDIPHQQQLIEEYREQLGKSKFMIKAEGKLQPYWMSMLRVWLKSLDVALEKEILAGRINMTNGQPIKVNGEKPVPEAMIAARLVCSAGTTYDCTDKLGKLKMVDANDIINPDGFYNYLTGWYNVDNMMYYVSQASFFPLPPGWAYDESKQQVVPPARRLLYSQISYYQNDLVDTPAIVKMIEEIRATSEEYTDRGLPNFPSGIAFTFWEQYLSLRWNLFMAICIIAAAVFTVISVLIFNPWAATMVMIIVVVITIELGGFMGIMGIKMNPISAVTLICAVGIGVEFTAHVVLAFLTSLGSVDDRLEACLRHMFVPVFHGAISTLLGVVMLIFSEFDFVVKYFFNTMTVLVMLGVFNGLCLLPVLLTLIGPDSELHPTDGSSHLSVPPSLRQQKSGKEMLEEGMRQRKSDKSSDVEMSARSST